MKTIKGYKVEDDDGIRLLNTLDLIELEQRRSKDKSRARRHRKTSKLMVKWLKSHLQDYGIMSNPYKNAVLRQYNIANGREEDAIVQLKLLREKDIVKVEETYE